MHGNIPNNPYSQLWPDLDQFMTVCFHEDIDYEFPALTIEESVRLEISNFFKTNTDQVERVRDQLQELLSEAKTESDLEKAAKGMWCRWDFSPWRPWFESVLKMFNEFLSKNKV